MRLIARLLILRLQAVRIRRHKPRSLRGFIRIRTRGDQPVRRIGDFHLRDRLMNGLKHDQNLFQPSLKTAGTHVNLLHALAIADRRHLPHRETLGKNAVVAGGEKPLARIHFFLVLNVVHQHRPIVALPFQRPAHPVFLGNHPGREVRVRDQEHLGRGRIRSHHLTHDSVGSHHGHAFFYAVSGSPVHEHHLRVGSDSIPDNSSRNRFRRRPALENAEGPHPVRSR